jgi:ATP-dependent protease ClpP protease subunit
LTLRAFPVRDWYEFRASSDGQKETTLFLYDEIGGFGKSAANFINDLQAVPSDHRLVLRIHSPGGSVLDGNAIFTALRAHPGGITTHIDGLAASMASVVAIAGDPVRMAGNGLMMIHNVSGGVQGDADDLRKMADTMDKVQQTIENAYVGKTGLGSAG